MHEEVLRVIHEVILRIFHPDPERLGKLPVDAVVPVELRLHGQYDPEDGARDWLDGRVNGQQWDPFRALPHARAHVDVT